MQKFRGVQMGIKKFAARAFPLGIDLRLEVWGSATRKPME
jgi:hypothetical protein